MASQFNYPTTYLRFGGKISPVNSTHQIGMLESFYLEGGLKSIYSFNQITDVYNTRSWIPDGRRQIGSIIYLQQEQVYIMDTGGTGTSGYATLSALTIGAPNFPGISSSAGMYISSGDIIVNAGSLTASGVYASSIIKLGGVSITSGSYGGTYTGSMLNTSVKVVATNGFANSTSDVLATFQVDSAGDLECNSLKETSLRRYKHDIINIVEPQFNNILKLNPVTFLYNSDVVQDVNDIKIRQAGFIAEQIQQIYPAVTWYKNGELAGIQYQRLTAYLTKAIQQLIVQNVQLKRRIKLIEQKL